MGFGMQPLTLELIDEGQFQFDLEQCLAEAQSILAEHRNIYGDQSHKATVEVVAKVKMTIVQASEGTVAIKAGVQVKRPERPASVTTAIESTDQTGKPAMFVKSGGSDADHPRQLKFAKRDGSLVDPGDGED